MTKTLKIIYIVFLFTNILLAKESSIFTKEEQAYLSENNIYTFTGDPNWLPYEAFDKNGNYLGIVADHLKLIEENTNIKFKKIASNTWSEAQDLALSGQVDIISGDAADQILNKQFKPIETYLKNPIVIVMKDVHKFIPDFNRIKGKVALIKDYGYTSDIYNMYPNTNFYEVSNIDEALECVSNNVCEAMLSSYLLASYSLHCYTYNDLHIIGSTDVTMDVTLFVNKEKPILHSIINKSMKRINMSEHNKIVDKWRNSNKPLLQYKNLPEILSAIAIFIVIILVLLYRQSSQRKKIEKLNKALQKDMQTNLKELDESRKIAKLGIWKLQHSDNKLIWNEDTYSIFGINNKEKIATLDDFFSAIHEEDMPKVSGAFENHLKTKEPYFITHRLLTINNELKYVNEWCRTTFDKAGNPLVSHGIIQDITEARANELNMRKELEKSVNIFGENVIASDSDLEGVITYASSALCRISGHTQEELIGQPHSILRHPSVNPKVFKNMWKTLESGQTWNGEFKNLKKDGGYYWVRNVISPKFDENNEIIGYSSIRENISPEKIKEQFLANMSHELRTPLNSMLGFIELIKEESNDESIQLYASTIQSSGASLLKVIEDILDFSKIESGSISIEEIDFDLEELSLTLKTLFDIQAIEKGINLTLTTAENTPKFVNTDPFRLRQIVSNFLNNAIKFTKKGKHIDLMISYENKNLIISVRDEGKGISQDKLSVIFEEFAQEDLSTTREYGGTGLGLAISKKLTDLLDGEISVTSELHVGSKFTISIPVKKACPVIKKDIDKIDQDFTSMNILVVEDNTANQLFMDVILKKMGISYDLANDGLEAVKLFSEATPNTYNLILMDENMPNMNGIEATKQILAMEKKEGLIHTPIIALTANALKGDRQKFLAAGMDEYLTKPINRRKIEEIFSKFISLQSD